MHWHKTRMTAANRLDSTAAQTPTDSSVRGHTVTLHFLDSPPHARPPVRPSLSQSGRVVCGRVDNFVSSFSSFFTFSLCLHYSRRSLIQDHRSISSRQIYFATIQEKIYFANTKTTTTIIKITTASTMFFRLIVSISILLLVLSTGSNGNEKSHGGNEKSSENIFVKIGCAALIALFVTYFVVVNYRSIRFRVTPLRLVLVRRSAKFIHIVNTSRVTLFYKLYVHPREIKTAMGSRPYGLITPGDDLPVRVIYNRSEPLPDDARISVVLSRSQTFKTMSWLDFIDWNPWSERVSISIILAANDDELRLMENEN